MVLWTNYLDGLSLWWNNVSQIAAFKTLSKGHEGFHLTKQKQSGTRSLNFCLVKVLWIFVSVMQSLRLEKMQ